MASQAKKAKSTDVNFLGLPAYEPAKKDEKYMCAAQRKYFVELLKTWLNNLEMDAKGTKTHLHSESMNCAEMVDRATQETDFSLELRTRDRERKLIRKIESTLEKLAEKDYGYCESCDAEIGVRRLEARPTATLCIDCKTVAEIQEERTAG